MMSFRHILFWVFCTVQKLHKTGTERTTDRHRPFYGSSGKLDCTDDGQTPSIFWKLPKIGRHGRWTDSVQFLKLQKMDGMDDRQAPQD